MKRRHEDVDNIMLCLRKGKPTVIKMRARIAASCGLTKQKYLCYVKLLNLHLTCLPELIGEEVCIRSGKSNSLNKMESGTFIAPKAAPPRGKYREDNLPQQT